jgi:hypothetical protein
VHRDPDLRSRAFASGGGRSRPLVWSLPPMLIRGLLVTMLLSLGMLARATPDDPPAKIPEPPDKAPEKNPWDGLKDSHARAAKAKYDAALEKARKEYEVRLADAKKTLLSDLKDAEVAATKDGNLDRALAIRGVKTAADEPPTTVAWDTPGVRPGALVFKGVQYRIFLGHMPWDEARARCKKLGGDLAVLDTKEKRVYCPGSTRCRGCGRSLPGREGAVAVGEREDGRSGELGFG